MSQTTDALRDQIRLGLDQLATLRDEVRVRVHLAGMEAKDAWNKLEPQVMGAEDLAKEVSDASHKAIEELVHKVKSFQETMKH